MLGTLVGIGLFGWTAIVGGQVHTGDGEPARVATVLIEDARIVAVAEGLAVPAGATVIDAAGKQVTPGLIDAWTGVGVVELDYVNITRDQDAGGDRPIRAAHRVRDAFDPRSVVIPVLRAHGLTTAISVPHGGLISGQAAAVSFGEPGQAMLRESAAMVVQLGAHESSSRGARMLALREALADARDFAAGREAYGRNQMRPLSSSRLDLEALQPVLRGEMPVAFVAHRAADIEAVLRLAADEKLRVIIVGGAEAWRVADALAAAKAPVILDPWDNLPQDFDRRGARSDAATLLHRAGATVIFSSFSTHQARTLRQRAGNAVRDGLPHPVALAAVTSAPAAAFGLADRGQIAPGQHADVVVWSGDPFELATQAEVIFIGGRRVALGHRQRALEQRYRAVGAKSESALTR